MKDKPARPYRPLTAIGSGRRLHPTQPSRLDRRLHFSKAVVRRTSGNFGWGWFADVQHAATLDPMDDAITTAFAPLIGLPCWGVQRGQGSMLTFEFGPPYLRIREPHVSNSPAAWIRERAAQRRVRPCGAWHLWVSRCHWRIAVAGEVVAEDESSQERIEAAARAIDGQKLTAFALDAATRTTTFTFDLGASLTTWPYADEIDEPWSLYQPEGQVLAYRSDGCRSLGSADEEPERQVWITVDQDVRVS